MIPRQKRTPGAPRPAASQNFEDKRNNSTEFSVVDGETQLRALAIRRLASAALRIGADQ